MFTLIGSSITNIFYFNIFLVHTDEYLHKWIKRKFKKKERLDQTTDVKGNAQPANTQVSGEDIEMQKSNKTTDEKTNTHPSPANEEVVPADVKAHDSDDTTDGTSSSRLEVDVKTKGSDQSLHETGNEHGYETPTLKLPTDGNAQPANAQVSDVDIETQEPNKTANEEDNFADVEAQGSDDTTDGITSSGPEVKKVVEADGKAQESGQSIHKTGKEQPAENEQPTKLPTDAFGDISFHPRVNKSGNTSKVGKRAIVNLVLGRSYFVRKSNMQYQCPIKGKRSFCK